MHTALKLDHWKPITYESALRKMLPVTLGMREWGSFVLPQAFVATKSSIAENTTGAHIKVFIPVLLRLFRSIQKYDD